MHCVVMHHSLELCVFVGETFFMNHCVYIYLCVNMCRLGTYMYIYIYIIYIYIYRVAQKNVPPEKIQYLSHKLRFFYQNFTM